MNLNQDQPSIESRVKDFVKSINNINILLIVFVVYGLICKLLISLNISLNSDDVDAGMVSLENWRHLNFLLESYYFPSADPFWFSDIIPFHLIPQIISDFNPMAIRIICYIIFLLSILIFSLLIKKISGDTTKALIFAAFIANLYPESVRFYLVPTCHNATIFFVGLSLLLILNSNLKLNARFLIFILLINSIVLSDSIFLAWFIIPFILCYILLYKNKSSESNFFIIFTALSVLFTYVYKSYFVEDFIPIAIHVKDLNTIIDANLPLYIEGLATLLLGNAYGIKPLSYIYILFLILLTYHVAVSYNFKNKYIFLFSIISAFVISIGYVFTDLCINFMTTRYLMFTALSIYLMISLSYRKDYKIWTLLIIILLSLSSISNYMFVDKLDYLPNNDELDLINYLTHNNLNYGYADYWDSNIITYLSNEKITVLPVTISYSKLMPFRWLSCEKWFEDGRDQNYSGGYFILIRSTLCSEGLEGFAKNASPKSILQFGSYSIYVFNDPMPLLDTARTAVALQANNGQYVYAEDEGRRKVAVNYDKIGEWETFGLIDMGNNTVALCAPNGQYLCAEGGGGRELAANRKSAGPWETFGLVKLGNNTVALRAYNGRYVSIGGAGGELEANSSSAGPNETFKLIYL
jgi:hypothetical protein